MPILLSADDLEPGMRLLHSIVRDKQTMLTSDKPLEDWEINSLRRHFPNLMVQICDPVLDEWVQFEDDSRDQEVASTVNRQMGRLMASVRDILSTKTALEGSDIAGLQKSISRVMEYINEHPGTAALLVRYEHANSYLQGHVGNVFYVSLLVGNTIRDYIYRERQRNTRADMLSMRYGMNLTPLALGCLFHDIGMVPIEHYYTQTEPLTDDDVQIIRQHPNVGVEMLPKEFDAVAKLVVRTHHENLDGTGYPAGIPGESLHIFARVIRAADALDAATSHHVYKNAKCAARVLWEMSDGPTSEHFDPTVVKILMGLVQPFPIGAKIKLNCGRYGVVVRHNRKRPFRPTLIIAFDENGKKLKKKHLEAPVDLACNDEVRMVEFAGDDLSCLNRVPDEDVWGEPEISPEDEDALLALAYP